MSGTCVAGIGMTEFSRASGRSAERLAVEAATAACEDAGLPTSAVDGIVPFPFGPSAEDLIAGLGLPDVTFTAVPHLGGASTVAGLRLAALAVANGAASCVLVFVARNGRSGSRVEQRIGVLLPGQRYRRQLEHPHGFTTPAQWYSMIARRHMHEFGTTREHLGAVALAMRAHAQLNPHAQMHGRPMTMEQYRSSRPIAEPYLLLDCCQETDGAGAVLVVAADRARDLRHRPVHLSGLAEGHPDSPDDLVNRRDFFTVGLTRAAPRAFAMAGVTPSDVDAAMIYDCFTFEVIQQLEEAGFCARGDGGPFVDDGGIALGGRLPVNPHGGLLSDGHIAGMNHVVEAVVQLRGDGGERQVPGAEVVAVTGWGDMGDGAIAVLTR
ncbi:lipid-transfer protein [Pseudonocardia sp. KRD291]|uniref:thiolase C-terminal domain-containing protein n=1 Tax=Pseudonocardia sp. KRD291 TaxID=2792007 RepID=UPI001C4A003D|nr:lipid-transfer protein [Pseudonocardia sp. KRD291]